MQSKKNYLNVIANDHNQRNMTFLKQFCLNSPEHMNLSRTFQHRPLFIHSFSECLHFKCVK